MTVPHLSVANKILVKLLRLSGCRYLREQGGAVSHFLQELKMTSSAVLNKLERDGLIAFDYGIENPNQKSRKSIQLTAAGYDFIYPLAEKNGWIESEIERPTEQIKSPVGEGFLLVVDDDAEEVVEPVRNRRVHIRRRLPKDRPPKLRTNEYTAAELLIEHLMDCPGGVLSMPAGGVEIEVAKLLGNGDRFVTQLMHHMVSDGLILRFAMAGTTCCIALPASRAAFEYEAAMADAKKKRGKFNPAAIKDAA